MRNPIIIVTEKESEVRNPIIILSRWPKNKVSLGFCVSTKDSGRLTKCWFYYPSTLLCTHVLDVCFLVLARVIIKIIVKNTLVKKYKRSQVWKIMITVRKKDEGEHQFEKLWANWFWLESAYNIAVVQYGKPRTDQQSNFFEGKWGQESYHHSEVWNPIIILGGWPKKKVKSGILSSFLAGNKKESKVRNPIIILGGWPKRKWGQESYHHSWQLTQKVNDI